MNKKKITMLSGIAALAIMASGAAIAITSIQDMGLAQAEEKQTTGFKANWSIADQGYLYTQSSDPRYEKVTANYYFTQFNSEHFEIGGDNGFLIQNLETLTLTFNNPVDESKLQLIKINQQDFGLDALTIEGNVIKTGLVNIKSFHELAIIKNQGFDFSLSNISFTYSCQ